MVLMSSPVASWTKVVAHQGEASTALPAAALSAIVIVCTIGDTWIMHTGAAGIGRTRLGCCSGTWTRCLRCEAQFDFVSKKHSYSWYEGEKKATCFLKLLKLLKTLKTPTLPQVLWKPETIVYPLFKNQRYLFLDKDRLQVTEIAPSSWRSSR